MATHHEARYLPYKAEDVFALIADIEAYPRFLPWCSAARILERNDCDGAEHIEADLVIRFKLFRERFRSRVALFPDRGEILIDYINGPFKYLNAQWNVAPSTNEKRGSRVTFSVDFQFRNAVLEQLIGLVFTEAMQRIVRAFEERAHVLYGERIQEDRS